MYRWITRSITIIFGFLLLYAVLNLKRIGTPLPDGSRLVFVGTTHGKGIHKPPPAPKTVGSVVRKAAGQNFWENYNPFPVESDETLFWFRRLPTDEALVPLAAVAFDEHDNTLYIPFDAPYVRVPALSGWGKNIHLTVYAADGLSSVPARTYSEPNRFAGKYRPFDAEALPIRKKDNQIEVTLEKFGNVQFVPTMDWPGARHRVALPFRSRIKFSVRVNDAVPEDYRIELPVIETPSGYRQEFLTGRRFMGPDGQFYTDSGRRLVTADFDSSFSVPLPPENVRFTVAVTDLVGTPGDELVFPQIPVPVSETVTTLTTCVQNGKSRELSRPLILHAAAADTGKDRMLWMWIELPREELPGNRIAGRITSITNSQGNELEMADADARPSGRRVGNERNVTIRFTPFKRSRFEFYVKPEIYDEAGS